MIDEGQMKNDNHLTGTATLHASGWSLSPFVRLCRCRRNNYCTEREERETWYENIENGLDFTVIVLAAISDRRKNAITENEHNNQLTLCIASEGGKQRSSNRVRGWAASRSEHAGDGALHHGGRRRQAAVELFWCSFHVDSGFWFIDVVSPCGKTGRL